MPWSSGLENQRGNITSLLGVLAQLKEGKKNRRASVLSNILDIGAGFGGAALQNQWAKKAVQEQRPYDIARQKYEQEQQNQRQTQDIWARQQDTATQHGYRMQELERQIGAGMFDRGGGDKEDASKLIPYDIASQAWDTWWERLQSANPKRQMSAKDFDQFRAVAVEAGAKYGFAREQMEDAVNTLAQSYGFDVAPNVSTAAPSATPPKTPRVPPRGFAEHGRATIEGIAGAGRALAAEAGKAWKGVKASFGGGTTEQTVLDALAQAKQLIPPQATPEVSKLEAEIMQAGALPPERLQQIMDRIAQLVRPK